MSTRRRNPSSSGAVRTGVVFVLSVVMFGAGAASSYFWLTSQEGPMTTAAAVSPAPPSPEAVPSAESPATAPPAPAPPAASPVAPTSTPPVSVPAAGRPPVRRAGPASSPQVARLPETQGPAAESNPTARGVPVHPPALGGRRFVLGTPVVESLKPIDTQLAGFEAGGVGVKRAPQVDGELDLVMEPTPASPGDPYSVMVYLRNSGRKPIRIDGLKVSMAVDGQSSVRPIPPKVREVRPTERRLIEELPGVWKEGIQSWEVEVVVTSKGQDAYRNRLSLK
jgi:hypothetical protein